MNRRDVLRAMALGGGIVAGELWIPGQRLISIPKPRPTVWCGVDIGTEASSIVWSQLQRCPGKVSVVRILGSLTVDGPVPSGFVRDGLQITDIPPEVLQGVRAVRLDERSAELHGDWTYRNGRLVPSAEPGDAGAS